MRRIHALIFVALTLLGSVMYIAPPSGYSCSLVYSEDFSSDPTGWSDNATALCPIARDGATNTYQRTALITGTCLEPNAVAQREQDLNLHNVALKAKVASYTAGDFDPGLVWKMPDGGAGQYTSHYRLQCDTEACSTGLDWVSPSGVIDTCMTFGAVPQGGYVGLYAGDVGANTIVHAWNFGTSDPGDDVATWGPPDCEFRDCGTDCLLVGTRSGLWYASNGSLSINDHLAYDEFRAFNCDAPPVPQ